MKDNWITVFLMALVGGAALCLLLLIVEMQNEITRLHTIANTEYNRGLADGAKRQALSTKPCACTCNTQQWLQEGATWKTKNVKAGSK